MFRNDFRAAEEYGLYLYLNRDAIKYDEDQNNDDHLFVEFSLFPRFFLARCSEAGFGGHSVGRESGAYLPNAVPLLWVI